MRDLGSRPVRIVHVIRRYHPLIGGTERYARDLARAQSRRGDHVRVITLDRDTSGVEDGRLEAAANDGSIAVTRLPGIGTKRWAFTLRPDVLVREVAGARVVHVHDIRFMVGLVAVTARARHIPCLVHTHGLVFHTTDLRRLKAAVLRWYHAPLLRLTGAWIVCSSEADRVNLLRVAPSLRLRAVTIDNAVDLCALLEARRAPVPGLVVVAGRVTATKGIDRLIRTLAAIPDVPWRLEVHGAAEADELARLQDIANTLGISGRVEFAGRYDDAELPAIYGRATVAAFPSRAEGFGIALVEAMAAGAPIVASDLPSHRAILGPAAPDALVDFDSVAAVAALRGALSRAPATGDLISNALRERARQYDVGTLVASLDRLAGTNGARPLR